MCGITGIVHADLDRPVDPTVLAAMNDTLAPRGPDGAGTMVAGGVGLAMRRLAIIDVAGGDQPIHSEDGAVSVVFNGELYNFAELRAELEGAGHRFSTRSDTEVLVHGYEQWGAAALCRRLNGMAAFALWDRRARRLVLGRDRLGKKPLFIAWRPSLGLLFASEIKALLAHPSVEATPDYGSLWHLLSLEAAPPGRSCFAGIRRLPPASVLEWEPASGKPPRVETYWRCDYTPKHRADVGEAAEELRDIVERAVARRLVAEVPLGAFLSGGLDSSIIVGLMAKDSSQPVKTFTVTFGEGAFDESPHARTVARHFGCEHHEERARWAPEESLSAIIAACDEPLADPAMLPLLHLARHTRRHVTVALSGDGGDETHAGYQRYGLDRWFAHTPPAVQWAVAQLVGPLGALVPSSPDLPAERNPALVLQRLGQALRTSPHASRLRWTGMFSESAKGAIATPAFREAARNADTEQLHAEFARRHARGLGVIDRHLAIDAALYLESVLLLKADRATMAASLEARSPFLDVEHVEFAARLPEAMKWRGGAGKWLLKRAFGDLLPRGILARPKQGFAVPLGVWFRGRLGEVARDRLLDPAAFVAPLFDRAQIAALLREHRAGRADHGKRLWALLLIEEWFAQRIRQHPLRTSTP